MPLFLKSLSRSRDPFEPLRPQHTHIKKTKVCIYVTFLASFSFMNASVKAEPGK